MLASEPIKSYESFCPQELSMEGDVVGLQIGSLDKEIQKVMVTLDVRENTVAEAIEKGVDLIIAKHAPIFRPVKDLVSSPDRDILLDLLSMILQSMWAIPILMWLMMVSMIGFVTYLILRRPLI